tara:strand:+ start:228 stop:461 length:234 start_codon:yes stop_codon:yes gene_type:complete
MDSITDNSVDESVSTKTPEENVPAIGLDVVLGYLASLADSLEQISRRIKDDVSGLIVQANKDNPEEIHEGDTNDDEE